MINDKVQFAEMLPSSNISETVYGAYARQCEGIREGILRAVENAGPYNISLALVEAEHTDETPMTGAFFFNGRAFYRSKNGDSEAEFKLVFRDGAVMAHSGSKKKSRKLLQALPLLLGYKIKGMEKTEKGTKAVYVARREEAGQQKTSPTFGTYHEPAKKGGWGN